MKGVKWRRRWISLSSLAILALAAIIGLLLYTGVLSIHHPERQGYTVRGVDVSSYQGTIDWSVLAEQDIQFAYIKATEGSSLVDPCFSDNFQQAVQTPLYVGAYHFFSYDSPADTQADLFLQTVPLDQATLPPAVDVEFYGDHDKNPPDPGRVRQELQILLDRLEEAGGKRPVLYATARSYALYLSEHFEEYPIWIRDLLNQPRLPDGKEWTFWQYNSRGRLKGYTGREPYIDLNVFGGTAEEWQRFVSSSPTDPHKEAAVRSKSAAAAFWCADIGM